MPEESQPLPAQQALESIESEIDAGRIQVHRSVADVAYISFLVGDHVPDHPLQLHGRCAKEVLTAFFWRAKKVLLKRSEADLVLTALAGRAASCPRGRISDPDLLRLVDTEPTLAVIVEWTAAKGVPRWEDRMETLWKNLREFAKRRGLLRLGPNRFPGGANILSCKLTQFRPILEQLGIVVTISRSNGSQVVLERRLDD